jgi:hypothetical protein
VFFSFLSSISLISCILPFHPFSLQTLPVSYTLPSLCNLAFLCPLLAPLSNIFFALSLLRLFLPCPDLCPYTLYHALKHHHSPPEITSLLSVFYSPNTSYYLICFPHYLSDMCLIRGSFIECVIQAFELVYLFFFPSFPVPLILFTLPLSIVKRRPEGNNAYILPPFFFN